MKQDNKQTSELGQIVDGTLEYVREHCSDKDLGYVQGLRNYLQILYNRTVDNKNRLVSRFKLEESEDVKNEITETVKGLYGVLIRIEKKVVFLNSLISERQLEH